MVIEEEVAVVMEAKVVEVGQAEMDAAAAKVQAIARSQKTRAAAQEKAKVAKEGAAEEKAAAAETAAAEENAAAPPERNPLAPVVSWVSGIFAPWCAAQPPRAPHSHPLRRTIAGAAAPPPPPPGHHRSRTPPPPPPPRTSPHRLASTCAHAAPLFPRLPAPPPRLSPLSRLLGTQHGGSRGRAKAEEIALETAPAKEKAAKEAAAAAQTVQAAAFSTMVSHQVPCFVEIMAGADEAGKKAEFSLPGLLSQPRVRNSSKPNLVDSVVGWVSGIFSPRCATQSPP